MEEWVQAKGGVNGRKNVQGVNPGRLEPRKVKTGMHVGRKAREGRAQKAWK